MGRDDGAGPALRLTDPIREALVAVVDRLAAHEVPYAVGGSLLLRLGGLDVTVGDIDLLADAAARGRLLDALAGWQFRVRDPRSRPWDSAWFVTAQCPGVGGPVGVDVIGGPAILIDGVLAEVPVAPSRSVTVDGRTVDLGDLAVWHHVYRVVDPAKADLVAAVLPAAELDAAAARMGIAAG